MTDTGIMRLDTGQKEISFSLPVEKITNNEFFKANTILQQHCFRPVVKLYFAVEFCAVHAVLSCSPAWFGFSCLSAHPHVPSS